MFRFKNLILFATVFSTFKVSANNVQITNISITNDSTITFDISWENSWKVNVAPNNSDAVWVFVKKRDCASMLWSHVNLSPTISNHTAASPLEVYIDGKDGAAAAKGVFLRRSALGVGNISSTTISLRMIGLTAGQFDFQVFGIEMVQIPQESFYIGDGISTGTFRDGGSTSPFFIDSESAIAYGTTAGKLTANSSVPLNLPSSYPKGYNEIYCMKYEISQGQYVDFVNTLNSAQGAIRNSSGVFNRINITGSWPSVIANTPHRAMIYLSWADLLAYLDWSALRPMTELEYEKICRGPIYPVSNAYAWGTSLIVDANTVINDGTSSEGVSNTIPAGTGIASYANNTILGPLRCGFAAKPGTNRFQAGATYYGVMEMSGNVTESVVNTCYAISTSFQAILGDGEISNAPSPGYANVSTWPSPTSSSSNHPGSGRGLKGGAFHNSGSQLQISDRTEITSVYTGRDYYGGRGVR